MSSITIDNSGSEYYNRQNGQAFFGQFGVTRFFPVMDRLYFTVGGNVVEAYANTRGELTANGISSTSNSSQLTTILGISLGLTYFINRKWMVYTSMGLLNYQLNYNLDSDQIRHSILFSARSNSFSVGVRYAIGKGTS